VVDLSGNEERELRREPLLEQHRSLSRRVNLSPERRLPELVLGSNGRGRLSPSSSGDDVEVGGNVNVRRKLVVVGGSEDTLSLVLKGSGPLVEGRRAGRGGERVGELERGGEFGEEGRGILGGLLGFLEDVLDSKGQTRSDSGEDRGDVDTVSVGEGRVDGLERDGLSRKGDLVLKLDHRVSGNGRELREREER